MLGKIFGFLFGNNEAQIKEELEKGAFLIDVRTPQEYDNFHIKDSSNHPLNNIAESSKILDKTQSYIVYCRSGNRSARAVQILRNAGFEHVLDGKRITTINNLI